MRRMFGIHSERYSRIIELILEYHINSYNNCIRTWSSSSRFEQIFHLYSTKFYVYRIYIYIYSRTIRWRTIAYCELLYAGKCHKINDCIALFTVLSSARDLSSLTI